ncbi:hypothetical protein [Ancylothrix sp. D3o]|nr:hypothetical protein [Ancylothrix sp. D3o]
MPVDVRGPVKLSASGNIERPMNLPESLDIEAPVEFACASRC